MGNLHNVEIAKTEHGETVLLDGKEIKGLKDFTVIRKANNLAVLQLELYVGEVDAVDVRAQFAAKEFEKWAEVFNRKLIFTHSKE